MYKNEVIITGANNVLTTRATEKPGPLRLKQVTPGGCSINPSSEKGKTAKVNDKIHTQRYSFIVFREESWLREVFTMQVYLSQAINRNVYMLAYPTVSNKTPYTEQNGPLQSILPYLCKGKAFPGKRCPTRQKVPNTPSTSPSNTSGKAWAQKRYIAFA